MRELMRGFTLGKNVTLCLTMVLLSGCGKKHEDAPAVQKPQPPAATSAPVSSEKPSEQQVRALRRYNENAWFVQQAMQLGPWDETLGAAVSKLVKEATPDWDHADPSHSEIRGPEV